MWADPSDAGFGKGMLAKVVAFANEVKGKAEQGLSDIAAKEAAQAAAAAASFAASLDAMHACRECHESVANVTEGGGKIMTCQCYAVDPSTGLRVCEDCLDLDNGIGETAGMCMDCEELVCYAHCAAARCPWEDCDHPVVCENCNTGFNACQCGSTEICDNCHSDLSYNSSDHICATCEEFLCDDCPIDGSCDVCGKKVCRSCKTKTTPCPGNDIKLCEECYEDYECVDCDYCVYGIR